MKCPVCGVGTLVSEGADAGSRFEQFVCDNCNVKITVEQPDTIDELKVWITADCEGNVTSYIHPEELSSSIDNLEDAECLNQLDDSVVACIDKKVFEQLKNIFTDI